MKITRLERAKTTDRINIFVDEEYLFSIEENTLVKFGLYKDKHLNKEEIQEIQRYDTYEYLYSKALGYISIRARSEKEVWKYLKNKLKKLKDEEKNLTEIVGKVVAKLKENKYLDDKNFAKWVVNSKLNQKKYSRKQIRQRLFQSGISREITNDLLNKEENIEKEQESLKKLAKKKAKQLESQDIPVAKRKEKLIIYLQGKGFSWDEIKKLRIEKEK